PAPALASVTGALRPSASASASPAEGRRPLTRRSASPAEGRRPLTRRSPVRPKAGGRSRDDRPVYGNSSPWCALDRANAKRSARGFRPVSSDDYVSGRRPSVGLADGLCFTAAALRVGWPSGRNLLLG